MTEFKELPFVYQAETTVHIKWWAQRGIVVSEEKFGEALKKEALKIWNERIYDKHNILNLLSSHNEKRGSVEKILARLLHYRNHGKFGDAVDEMYRGYGGIYIPVLNQVHQERLEEIRSLHNQLEKLNSSAPSITTTKTLNSISDDRGSLISIRTSWADLQELFNKNQHSFIDKDNGWAFRDSYLNKEFDYFTGLENKDLGYSWNWYFEHFKSQKRLFIDNGDRVSGLRAFKFLQRCIGNEPLLIEDQQTIKQELNNKDKQINNLNSQIDNLKKRPTQEELDKLNNQIANLNKQISNLEKSTSNKDEIDKLNKENEDLKAKKSDLERKLKEAEESQSRKTLEGLRKQLRDAKNEHRDCEQKEKDALRSKEIAEDEKQDALNEVGDLKKRIKEDYSQRPTQVQFKQVKDDLKNVRRERDDALKNAEKHTDVDLKPADLPVDWKEQLSKAKTNESDLKSEKDKNTNLAKDLKDSQADLTKSKNEVKRLAGEKVQLEKDLNDKNDDLTLTQELLDKAKADKLEREQELNGRIADLEADKDALEASLNSEKNKNAQLEKDIKIKEVANKNLNSQITTLKNDNTQLLGKIQDLKNDNAKLEQDKLALEAKVINDKVDWDDEVRDLKNQITILEKDKKTTESALKSWTDTFPNSTPDQIKNEYDQPKGTKLTSEQQEVIADWDEFKAEHLENLKQSIADKINHLISQFGDSLGLTKDKINDVYKQDYELMLDKQLTWENRDRAEDYSNSLQNLALKIAFEIAEEKHKQRKSQVSTLSDVLKDRMKSMMSKLSKEIKNAPVIGDTDDNPFHKNEYRVLSHEKANIESHNNFWQAQKIVETQMLLQVEEVRTNY